jgi:hypothetical protein
MASTGIEPFLKGNTGRNTRGLLRIVILCTIAAAAVASRLFSVIRAFSLPIACVFAGELLLTCSVGFESIINECAWSYTVIRSAPSERGLNRRSNKLLTIW